MTRRERIQFWLLWLFLGLVPLFLRPLWEPDEGRYAEIPREMLATGDWLTPHLNAVLYFEKPPLQYWLSAFSMRVFGTSAWAARLPLALATGLAMWAAWRLARRLGATTPMWAAFMAISCLFGYVCGQILTLDALFAAFLLVSLAAFLEAVDGRLARKGALPWTLLYHASLALAFLTKGLAALVLVGGTLAFAFPFAWKHRSLRAAVLRTVFDPLGLAVFVAVGAPWFILMEWVNPGHAHFFFIREHFQRFSSHVHARQGHANPLLDKLYFVPILAFGMLPWLSATLVGLWRGLKFMRLRGPRTERGPMLRWNVAVLVMAFAVPFVFFSLSGSKLPTYILPGVVPLVVLAAAFEETHEAWRTLRWSGRELIVLGLLFGVGMPLFVKDGGQRLVAEHPVLMVWPLLLGLTLVVLGFWARRPKTLSGQRWMVLHGSALLLLTLALQALGGARKSVGHLVAKAPANAQWISHGYYWQGIAFYSGSRPVVISGTGELAYGASQLPEAERQVWFQEDPLALNGVAERLRREQPGRPVWALFDRSSWDPLPDEVRARWEIVARTPSARLGRFLD